MEDIQKQYPHRIKLLLIAMNNYYCRRNRVMMPTHPWSLPSKEVSRDGRLQSPENGCQDITTLYMENGCGADVTSWV